MENSYSNGDQTMYKVETTVMDSKCYVANQERDGSDGEMVTFVMPENVDNAKIQVRINFKCSLKHLRS